MLLHCILLPAIFTGQLAGQYTRHAASVHASSLPATLRMCLQETKVRAIQAEALQPLLGWLGSSSSSAAVRQLCCRSLGSICQLQQGRAAFAAAGGIPVLTKALETTPDAAVAAMKVGGAHLLLSKLAYALAATC
jgi:hypothetical protein